jgi:hypothetical protein
MNILSSSTEKKRLLREKYKIIFLRYLLETWNANFGSLLSQFSLSPFYCIY